MGRGEVINNTVMSMMKKSSFLGLLAALSSVCFSLSASAQSSSANHSFFQWHSSNIQLLRGNSYKLGSEDRTIMTLEHANCFKYGDFFVFFDHTWPDEGNSSYYIEPTLRMSLGKTFGLKLNAKVVKDIFIAGQIEKPKGKDTRKLLGFAVDFNLPHFVFFKSHLFFRDNPDLDGQTYQVTFSWMRPFTVNNLHFLAEGFADLVGSEGNRDPYQLIVPRFLLDVGVLAGAKKGKAWAGIEWQYWHNKFGVAGVTESVPQLQLKYVF